MIGVAPEFMSAWLITGNYRHYFIPHFRLGNNIAFVLYYRVPITVQTIQESTCGSLSGPCSIVRNDGYFDLPERNFKFALEVDYEFVSGSPGNTIEDKAATAVTQIIFKLAPIEETLDHYFRISLTCGIDPANSPNHPLNISNLDGVIVILNTSIDDGLEEADFSTNASVRVINELKRHYSTDPFRRCLYVNQIQLITGKTPGLVLGRSVGAISESNSSNFWCERESDFYSAPFGGASFAYQNPELMAGENDKGGRILHELLHGFGLPDLDDTQSCFECCTGSTPGIMCQGQSYQLADRNFYYIYSKHQTTIRSNLVNHGQCLLIQNEALECNSVCSSIDECKVILEFDTDYPEVITLDCGEAPNLNYKLKVKNNCFSRTLQQVRVRFVRNFLELITFPPEFVITDPTESFRYLTYSPSVNLSPGEEKEFDFSFQFTNYTPNNFSTSIDGEITISTTSGFETFDRSETFTIPAPSEFSGGTIQDPILLSDIAGDFFSAFPAEGLNNETILFDGVLAIDQDYEFNEANLLMGPNSAIIIQNGSNVRINHSTFTPCGEAPWESIFAQNGSKIEVSNSRFELAKTAFSLQDGTIISLTENEFYNNETSLHFLGDSEGATQVDLVTLRKNLFTVDEANSFDQTTGINIKRQGSQRWTLIYGGQNGENTFDGLNTGIYAEDCAIWIRENFFYNISDFAVRLNGTASSLTNNFTFFSGTSNGPSIESCRYGVYSEGHSILQMTYVHMNNVLVGLHSNSLRSQLLNRNLLTNIKMVGFSLGSQSSTPSLVRIFDNTISISAIDFGFINTFGRAGIRLLGNSVSNSQFQVTGNSINVAASGRSVTDGVLAIDVNNLSITENTIELAEGLRGTGIHLQGGVEPFVSCNSISAPISGLDNPRYKRAIVLESITAPKISCNQTNGTEVGILFRGFNLGTQLETNEFGTHTRGLQIGHNGANGTTIPAAIGNQNHHGNKWVGISGEGNFQAFLNSPSQEFIDLSRFLVDANLCNQLFADNNASEFDWFRVNPSEGATLVCAENENFSCNETLIDCLGDDFGAGLAKPLEELEIKIISDAAIINQFAGNAEIANAQLLLEGLKGKYTSSEELSAYLAQADGEAAQVIRWAANYYQSLSELESNQLTLLSTSLDELSLYTLQADRNTNEYSREWQHKMNELNSLLGLTDYSALISANSTQITQEYAQEYSSALELQLSHLVLSESEPSEELLKEIMETASGCFYEAGVKVYPARSLYLQLHPEALVEDYCTESVLELRPMIPKSVSLANSVLALFPNPATNRLTVNAKLEKFDDGFAIWELINGQGRKVMSGSITPEVLQNGFDLDLSKVNAGVYFFRVYGQHFYHNAKLVIK